MRDTVLQMKGKQNIKENLKISPLLENDEIGHPQLRWRSQYPLQEDGTDNAWT
jgi:hypothetical protein